MKYKPKHISKPYLLIRRKRRIWHSIVGVLSSIVLFCTVYALIYPAITITTDCGMVEHIHTKELCYTSVTPTDVSLICTNESIGVHTHNDSCKNKQDEIQCGYADFIVHSHDELCFDDKDTLICTLPEIKEHTHNENCYQQSQSSASGETEAEKVLICEEKEIVLHAHSSDCFDEEGLLKCAQMEILSHTHTEGCRKTSIGEEEMVLTCELKEHTHTPDCTAKKSIKSNDDTQPEGTYAVQPLAETERELVESGTCSTNSTWSYYSDGTLVISGKGNIPNYSSSNFPWIAYQTSIKKVIVEDGISAIGNCSFYNCINLTSVDLPDTLATINYAAFSGCSSLTSISIPEKLSTISNNAFHSCTNLTSVDFSSATKLTTIASHAFYNCTGLTSLDFPDSLQTIQNNAFQNCSNLTSVNFSSNLVSISSEVFRSCSSLSEVDMTNTQLTTIGQSAFSDCTALTSVKLPDSLTSLGKSSFQNCTALTYVDLSNVGLTNTGQHVFSGCTGLTAVKLPKNLESIGSYAFQNCTSLTDVYLPDSLISIGTYAFSHCTGLTSVDLPDSMTSIGNYAFQSCSGLTSVEFPDSLTSIGSNAFTDCTSLTEVDLSITNLTNVSQSAFQNCTGLISVDLSNTSLTSINAYTFYGCSKLASINLSNTNITSIGNRSFTRCTSLSNLDLPSTVTRIDQNSFTGCSSLTNFDFPDKLAQLGDSAFNGCTSLTALVLSNTALTTINNSVFGGCTGLTSVNLPNNLIDIKKEAFNNCSKLTNITIPDTLTNIDSSAFYGCSSLLAIDLSNTNLTTIGSSAFYNCNNMTSIKLPYTLTTIGNSAFQYCRKLIDVDLTNTSITSIGTSAFSTCTDITDIIIPNELTSLGAKAFYNCFSLNNVTLQSSALSSVSSDAFQACDIQDLIIGEQVDELYCDLLTAANAKTVKFIGKNEFIYYGNNFPVVNGDHIVTLTDGVTYLVDENGILSEAKSTFTDTNVTWSVKDGVLTISGTGKVPDFSSSSPAPWNVFASEINKVVLKDGITAIGNYAFKNIEALAEIIIPESLESIGNNAFENCSGLTKINLPSNLSSIGNYAFKNCGTLTNITIPENVTSIGKGAFLSCSNLTEVTIENTEANIGDGAYCNCTSLEKVNGMNTLDAVMKAFSLTDKSIFYNTILWFTDRGDSYQVTSDIETIDNTGRKITMITPHAGKELLTGVPADTAITIDKGVADQTDYVRIYLAFSGNGSFNFTEGDFTLDNGMQISVKLSDTPNIYYVEVNPLKAGDTLDLTLNPVYNNIHSEGGTVDIWLSVLSETEREAIGNSITIPAQTHRVTWITEPAEFPVKKTTNTNTGIVKGDGTESGAITANNLSYKITMTKVNQATSNGQDHMVRAEFADRLTLPKNFVWTEGMFDAIEAKHYWWDGQNIYVTVNNKDLQLCSFSSIKAGDFAWPGIETDDKGNKTVIIHWSHTNTNADMEISNFTTTLTFGNDVIVVKDIDALTKEVIESGETSKNYNFHNEITCNQYFNYSDVQTQESTCDLNVSVSTANLTIGKSGNNTIHMGDSATYTITLKNDGSFPYESLTRVRDPLSNYFYIDPDQMQSLFNTDRDGKLLTITISKAVLYNEIIRETVKDINGNEYIITQQEMGTATPHNSYVADTKADNQYIRSSNATLTLAWADKLNHLILTVDAGDDTDSACYSVGEGCDYATIQDALDGIGYLVTFNDLYTCQWDMTDQTLYSGETRVFSLPMRAKNSMMCLIGDQPLFIKDSSTFQSGVPNYAYAYYQTGQEAEAHIYSYNTRTISRDFKIYKGAHNIKDLSTEAREAESGDVLRYYIDLDYSSDKKNGAYNGAPLVDHMKGAQVLLANAEDNPHLSELGLEIYTVNNINYYILNKAGTYHNVMFDGYLADHVNITKTEFGLDTMIYWYLSSAQSCDVYYYVLVDLEKAALDINDANTIIFALDNEVWLNDHQTHRLYDNIGIKGTRLFIHKYIVENFPEEELSITSGEYNNHKSSEDKLSDRCTIEAGKQVTYQLHLDGRGTNNVVINGSSMYDTLPESIDEYWTKENVHLFYTIGTDSAATFTCTNGSEWFIDTDDNGQQSIRWADDFKINMNGNVYIYVTLAFPSGQAWTDYAHTFGSAGLKNSFHVNQLQDEVFHDIGVTSKAVLQKGVLYTGSYKSDTFSESNYQKNATDTALSTYANDGDYRGVVTYYITLYNSGDTRLYLSEIQDVLPSGFSFIGMKRSSGTPVYDGSSSNYNNLVRVTDKSGNAVTYKNAYITTSTTRLPEGQVQITFKLRNYSSAYNLSYDSNLDKYYLSSGEALSIIYHCATNSYANSKDVADNYVAMPIYDYNGHGVWVDRDSVIDRKTSENQISNNGGCDIYDNQQAELLGMNTSNTDKFTKWLVSDVKLYRGKIVPGITKTAESNYGYVTDNINWSVTTTNSGTDTMYAYTLTDTMMAPYQFTGDVKYSIAKNNSTATTYTLFSFVNRKDGDTSVTIKSPVESAVLDLTTGEPVPINTTFSFENKTTTITPLVSLKRDEAGNEILAIQFAEKDHRSTGIPIDGKGTLKITTTNLSTSMKNKTYVNTAYVTPVQEYEKSMVTQGSNTLFYGKPSVVSEANVAVSYGYATAALKSVTELGDTPNSAQSNSSTNYIVLSDKSNTFRYDLTVSNTGGSTASRAMDLLVMINNLPEADDHFTFYEDIYRYSEFDIGFAEDPQVVVCVNNVPLSEDQYSIDFSPSTTFTDADWSGNESTTEWHSECSDNMRSIRMIIKDADGNTIPRDSVITLSFNAKIKSPEDALPSQIAWNSFGYRYSLVNNDTELEAAPSKVGVKIASIPMLTKKLIDSNGYTYPAVANETFRFLIYKDKTKDFSSFKASDVVELLQNQGIPFTIVDLPVGKGNTESETVALDNLYVWEANEDEELTETTTPWSWGNLESYSIVELPSDDSVYVFGALNDVRPNNYTFIYQSALPLSLSGTNVRNLWSLLLNKQDYLNQKPLFGSVFGLYSKLETDQISDGDYETSIDYYGVSPDRIITTTTESGEVITWYLMDIQRSNESGEILWSGLTEKEYYLLELRAPDGYKLNPEGQSIESPESCKGTKSLILNNTPGYKLPHTGATGTMGFYITGIILLAAAVLLIPAVSKTRKRSTYL